MNKLTVTEHRVAYDDFETIIVEETETGTIVRTIATVNVPEYAEKFVDTAAQIVRLERLEQLAREYFKETKGLANFAHIEYEELESLFTARALEGK